MDIPNKTFRHWRIEDDAGIPVIRLDQAGNGVNLLSRDVLLELEELLMALKHQQIPGLIIASGKAKGFIAGADVHEFLPIVDPGDALPLVKRGQSILQRLEELPFPSVAEINGFCLGGGLELALACRYRVASTEPQTVFGLPEVKLGIHPGFGGNVRLPRLIGDLAALNLILSGRTISSREAKRLGVVDHAVPMRQLRAASIAMIHTPPERQKKFFDLRWLAHWPLRPIVALALKHKMKKLAAVEHYPAPSAIIHLWQKYAASPLEQQYQAEGESIARLMVGETSRQLVRTFLLRERLKGLGGGHPSNIRFVHVIGAGVMGGDIAAWCALRGLTVTLTDTRPQGIGAAMVRAKRLFSDKLRDETLVQAAMDRLIPDLAGDGLGRADLVLEAVIENLEVKRALFHTIEAKAALHAILATNTSSIPLEEIAPALNHPERLIGIHFFNPVHRMPLVEVVLGEKTSAEMAQQTMALVNQLDRLPLPVTSSPGFLVNRLLVPYLLEAVKLVAEGVAVKAIDQAARNFGMPMGPLELSDSVGLDIALSVADRLAHPDAIPMLLREMVAMGHFGRKAGSGFYHYQQGKLQKPRMHGQNAPIDILDRLILPLVNEAMAALREGVVADADLLDAAMIFGTGFAPFRGGPMGYANHIGIHHLLNRLATLHKNHGGRFKADIGWEDPSLCNLIQKVKVHHEHDDPGHHPSIHGPHLAGALS